MKGGPSWRPRPASQRQRLSASYAAHLTLRNRVRISIARAVLGHSSGIRRQVATIADISSFLDWQEDHFGSVQTLRSKPALWDAMSARMRSSGERWHVMEFGVAYGHATGWWLAHHDADVIATWDGFDRFTGLPRPWRGMSAGSFGADGQPPSIIDGRVAWHVGNIEETIEAMDVGRIATGRRLAYFDLDLYEPSKVCWDWLRPHLKPGDLLYFDEAHDHDERRLLNESVLPAGEYARVGATVLNLALEIRSLR